jgi:hypothetical protein
VPEEAEAWALPQAEFGLDVIALAGQVGYREQRSVPQIHHALQVRGVSIDERSVTAPLHRLSPLCRPRYYLSRQPVAARPRRVGRSGAPPQ